MKNIVKNAQRLMKDLEKKKHPEYGPTKIKGKNLSRADVDTLEMLLESMIRENAFPSGFMPIYGENKEVLEAYGLPTAPANNFIF